MSNPTPDSDSYRLHAEAAVLGAMLNSGGEYDRMALEISVILEPEYFTSGKHRAIFEAIQEELNRNGAVDIVTVGQRLERRKLLAEIGGHRAVAEIAGANPTIANGLHYARIVRDNGRLHMLTVAGQNIAGIGADPSNTPDQAFETAMAAISEVSRYDGNEEKCDLATAAGEYLNGSPAQRAGHYAIIPTPLKDLNEILRGGFRAGQVAIVGASTGMGKTSLVTNFAVHAGFNGYAGILFSPEMTYEEVVSRVISSECGVSFHDIHEGIYTEEQQDKITYTVGTLGSIKLDIDCKKTMGIGHVMREAALAKADGRLDFIIIDYIQKLVPREEEGRWQPSMRSKVSRLSDDLHNIARGLNIAVIAVSQLNRNADQRPGPPKVSDLKESSDLEQSAHTVMLIHKDDNEPPATAGRSDIENRQIIVAKQRFGPQGTVNVWFEKRTALFADYDYLTVATA